MSGDPSLLHSLIQIWSLVAPKQQTDIEQSGKNQWMMSGQSSMEGQLRTLSSLSLQPDAAYRPALLYKFYLSNFPTHELIYLENHLRFVQILEKNTFTNFYYIKHSWESSSGVKHVNKFPLFEKQIK